MEKAMRDARYEIRVKKSKIFLICCLSFIVSVGISSFLPERIFKFILIWFSGIVMLAVVAFLFWNSRIVRIISLAGLFLFLGIWRYGLSFPENTPDKIWHYNGEKVKIAGIISDEPDEREKSVRLKIESKKIKIISAGSMESGTWNDVSGQILVTTNPYPEYNYGDEVEIECDLGAPEALNDFPYDRYLARYDIYSVCKYASLTPNPSPSRERGVKELIYSKIFQLKNIIREKIDLGLNEPEAGLAKGFILGDLKSIDNELGQKFSRVGISHIVAISGANISIVAGIVMSICLGVGLNRKYSFYFSTIFLVLYIILVGAPASAMRAGLMGFLVLWALYLGRLNKMTNALALAAGIMLLFNPKLLRDDIGFQLSFMALISIVYIYPIVGQWLEKIKIPKSLGIRDATAMTISAQLLTIPIIIYNFSQISLIAVLANVLVIWTLPFLMTALPVSISLSMAVGYFNILIFLPSQVVLKYIIFITEKLADLPYAFMELSSPWWGWIVLYYLAIAWFLFCHSRRAESR